MNCFMIHTSVIIMCIYIIIMPFIEKKWRIIKVEELDILEEYYDVVDSTSDNYIGAFVFLVLYWILGILVGCILGVLWYITIPLIVAYYIFKLIINRKKSKK